MRLWDLREYGRANSGKGFNVMDLEREIEARSETPHSVASAAAAAVRAKRMAAQAIDKTARPAAHPEERPQPAPAYEKMEEFGEVRSNGPKQRVANVLGAGFLDYDCWSSVGRSWFRRFCPQWNRQGRAGP
jgi:hypothetical protein